jgi:hypothetical protein
MTEGVFQHVADRVLEGLLEQLEVLIEVDNTLPEAEVTLAVRCMHLYLILHVILLKTVRSVVLMIFSSGPFVVLLIVVFIEI